MAIIINNLLSFDIVSVHPLPPSISTSSSSSHNCTQTGNNKKKVMGEKNFQLFYLLEAIRRERWRQRERQKEKYFSGMSKLCLRNAEVSDHRVKHGKKRKKKYRKRKFAHINTKLSISIRFYTIGCWRNSFFFVVACERHTKSSATKSLRHNKTAREL